MTMAVKPLAVKLRPKKVEDIVGQTHLLADGSPLRTLIDSDKLASIILFGPPGTGKTTIAEVIANSTKSKFVRMNATSATVKAIRKEGNEALKEDSKVVLFVDEIHRFSKTQQDVLLPFVEDGYIILIGATTENPFHSINSALLSRSHIFELYSLTETELAKLVWKGSKTLGIKIQAGALKHIIRIACGDARKAINTLDFAVELCDGKELTEQDVKDIAPNKYMVFGKGEHFDLASAYQGSIQASDADSAIYWLAKWLESGEDPRYIARRLMVSASEDAAGNPECAMVAHNAYVAACNIGRPECDIVLAHATILTAKAPRNKGVANAIWAAVSDVKRGRDEWVPKEMKDSHYPGAKDLGHGKYHDGADQKSYVGIDKKYVRGL